MKSAFTLLEILFAVAILAVLVAIAIPATTRATQYAARTKSICNLRQLGVAAHLYASEHDQSLPGQLPANPLSPINPPAGEGGDRWPRLLCAYLTPSDPRVFLDPTDRNAAGLPLDQVLSNEVNNTGYIYNGFDDLSSDGEPLASVPLTLIEHPTEVVLIGQKLPGAKEFYVDLLNAPLGSLLSLLNPAAFDGGSHYLYLDGSVRYLKQTEYSNNLWLVNKELHLPPIVNAMRGRYAREVAATG